MTRDGRKRPLILGIVTALLMSVAGGWCFDELENPHQTVAAAE
ncbi:hypothetical protein ACRCUN_23015 [Mycobacterium sp. LTG2003]